MYNKSEAEHYASLLRNLVLEGGKLARAMKAEASVEEKADRSLVTAADIAVTKLIKERLEAILKQDNHILIDEESVDTLPPVEEALSYDYQWVLDPVDGTAPYSIGLPFWGVSLGLMRKGEPWLGAIYLPDMDELFWTDGKGNVMFQKGASGAAEAKKLILGDMQVFEGTPYFVELRYPSKDGYTYGYPIRTGSAVAGACKFFLSLGVGYSVASNIWDSAAIMALGKALGCEMQKTSNGKKFDVFTANDLNARYRLFEPYIMAKPQNLGEMRRRALGY